MSFDRLATNDWRRRTTSQMVAAALDASSDGRRGVVLVHDTHANTVNALHSIISALSDSGYRFTMICGDGRGETPVTLADQRYVQATFRVFLGRGATPEEVQRWGSLLYYRYPKTALTDALARSPGWIGRMVDALYLATFGRHADSVGLEFWTGYVLAGRRVTDVGAELLASDEFFVRAGSTNHGYVSALYRTVLHRAPDAAGASHWEDLLVRGTSRLTISRTFFDSSESRLDRVNRTYRTVLGRPAEDAGRTHWTEQMLRFDDVQLASSLAVSPEF